MKTIGSRFLILFICIFPSLPVFAQDAPLADLLSNAKTCFENGDYQKARQYIKVYAVKDGNQQIALEISSKCKSCEEFLTTANKAYIEGDLQTAEQFYLKLKELNPKHPDIQEMIDKCRNTKDIQEDSASVQSVAPTISDKEQKTRDKLSLKSFKSFLFDNEYCNKKQNRYIAWSVVGTGYPWNLVTGIENRFGGIMGLGLYGDIGMDFTRITVNDDYDNYAHCIKTTFRYSLGLKIYLYKGLFLDFGTSSISTPADVDVDFFVGSSLESDEKEKVRKMVSVGRGPHFNIGYNYVGDLSHGDAYFLGVNFGFSHDVVNKKTIPSFNLKMGVAWGR